MSSTFHYVIDIALILMIIVYYYYNISMCKKCVYVTVRNHNFPFYRIRPWTEMTILRIPLLKILLLAWADSHVAEFYSDAFFSEAG